MQELQAAFPQEFSRGLSAVGIWLKTKMAKDMAAGTPGNARFTPINPTTQYIRGRENRWALRKWQMRGIGRKPGVEKGFGGKLPKLIRYKRDYGRQELQVGWIPGTIAGGDVIPTVVSFQEAQRRATSKKERHKFYQMGLDPGKTYTRPSREVIKPVRESRDTSDNVIRIIEGSVRHWLLAKGVKQYVKAGEAV